MASIGADGPFTGAVCYQGRPLFFKENCMIEVYGSYPAAYQVQITPCQGVQSGCEKSLAIVSNVLYYKSRGGVCAFDGSLPVQVGEEMVGVRVAVRDMVKGTDGVTPESQVYNWGIKKDASLDDGSHGQKAASSPVSSDALNNSISENALGVNRENVSALAAEKADVEGYRSPFAQLKKERAVLQQAIDSMDTRPMNPRVYNELNAYSRQLQHLDTTQRLIDQKKSILQQQQASGAPLSQIQQTQTDIAKLEKMLTTQQQKLQKAQQSPALQKVIEKTRAEMDTQAAENSRKDVLDISRTFDRIKAEGNIITDGSHLQNGKLQPNATYQTGEHEYIYQTNSDGLISKVYVETLQEKTHDGRLDHNPNTYGKQTGDHAGHLIGDRFGGSPEVDNLVSQAAFVNQSKYKAIENVWARALKAGQKVSVEITVNYDGTGMRPTSFAVEYTIDGKTTTKTINNKSSGGNKR